jgi:hypothetical protein
MLIAFKQGGCYLIIDFINENYSKLSFFPFFFQNAREYLDFLEEFLDRR